jgi:hypothetical protein
LAKSLQPEVPRLRKAFAAKRPTSARALIRERSPVYGFARHGILRTIRSTLAVKKFRIDVRYAALLALMFGAFCVVADAQTDCADGNGILDMTPPKDMTPEALIKKFTENEDKVKEARSHYTFTQDVMVQTLNDKTVDGQFHQIATVSYDEKGKREEKVTYAEQPTLRGISLTENDWDDIRTFMQWTLTTDLAPQYKLTYAGQQHVDDLDTYVFHIEPKTEEKNKRYFQGRIWVDNRDFQIVKLCGKTVPEQPRKRSQSAEVRPTFAGYREYIDGYWFPAYARADDTLTFRVESVHIREIVKFKDYKRTGATSAASKP